MDELETLQQEWIDRFRRLNDLPDLRGKIAAPLISVRARDKRSILYVGQATYGWRVDDTGWSPAELGVEESRRYTQRFLDENAPKRNSDFWKFGLDLNKRAADKWGRGSADPLGHISWTNLCKIGMRSGENPKGEVYEAQKDLAIRTLGQEIASYEPELVYFATHNEGVEILQDVIRDPKVASWTHIDETIWWRSARDEFPILVWSDHPGRKQNGLLDRWLAEVSLLLPE